MGQGMLSDYHSHRNDRDAQLVLDNCDEPRDGFVDGQQFYQDGWNVVVGSDSC